MHTLALATAAVLAARVHGNSIPFWDGDESYDIDQEVWDEAVENKNASALPLYLTGRDITMDFPGEAQQNWKLHFDVVGNYPVPEMEDTYMTAGQVTFGPDGGLRNNSISDTWGLHWAIHILEWSTDEDVVDFTCQDVVSSECYDAMVEQTHNGTSSSRPGNTQLPDECLEEFGDDALVSLGAQTRIVDMPFVQVFDADIVSQDAFEAYDRLTTYVHVIQFMFTTAIDGSEEGGQEFAPGAMACMRADYIEDGSRTYEESAATSALAGSGAAWVAVALSTMMMAGLLS